MQRALPILAGLAGASVACSATPGTAAPAEPPRIAARCDTAATPDALLGTFVRDHEMGDGEGGHEIWSFDRDGYVHWIQPGAKETGRYQVATIEHHVLGVALTQRRQGSQAEHLADDLAKFRLCGDTLVQFQDEYAYSEAVFARNLVNAE